MRTPKKTTIAPRKRFTLMCGRFTEPCLSLYNTETACQRKEFHFLLEKPSPDSVYHIEEVINVDSTAVPSAVREQRLEKWITEYGNAVWRTCFVYLSDAAQAEDAMQDTFLKAWNAMPQFEARNGASEKTWLMRIAMNVCVDYKRSKWFKHVDMSKALEDIPQSVSSVLPEDRSLLYDIMRLPPKFKQVILLYCFKTRP